MVLLPVCVNTAVVNCVMLYSDSDSDSGPPVPGKKEYIFTNKKDAVEAFKNLLRDKVTSAMACLCGCCPMLTRVLEEQPVPFPGHRS